MKAKRNGGNADLVKRLADFRRNLARDLDPDPWAEVPVPAAVFLADVCTALGLSERELREVLGREGVEVLIRVHEARVLPWEVVRELVWERNPEPIKGWAR